MLLTTHLIVSHGKKVPTRPIRNLPFIDYFSNFLLHALKIIRSDNKEVVLDDKRLTKIFKSVIKSEKDAASFSIEFIMKLLDLRLLFDKYIIKRKQDKWSLKKLLPQKADKDKYYYKDTFSQTEYEDDGSGQNRNIIMLLSMFHVISTDSDI